MWITITYTKSPSSMVVKYGAGKNGHHTASFKWGFISIIQVGFYFGDSSAKSSVRIYGTHAPFLSTLLEETSEKHAVKEILVGTGTGLSDWFLEFKECKSLCL